MRSAYTTSRGTRLRYGRSCSLPLLHDSDPTVQRLTNDILEELGDVRDDSRID